MNEEIQLRRRYKFDIEISKKLNSLLSLDNYHALIAVFYDYLIISAAVTLFIISHYFYIFSIFIIASRQRALSTLLHEAAHGRLVKNKNLNYCIGTFLSGYLIFWEYNTFTESHVKSHHIYLGDKIKDPDYYYHIESGLYDITSRTNFIIKYIIKPLLLGSVFSYVKYIFINRAPAFLKNKKQAFVMFMYLILILLTSLYFNFFTYLIVLWIVPLFTIFPIIGWFVELSEHYPLVAENKVDLYMTRNRFSHWMEAFFFSIHRENFHLVHHLRPGIPFWNLKKAHQILMSDSTYKNLNMKMGGIFFSSNKQQSFIANIINKDRKLFKANEIPCFLK